VGRRENEESRQLVQRCIDRAPGAWVEFCDKFQPTLRAVAWRYLKLNGQQPDDALLDDVMQDVFLALTRRDYRLLRNYNPHYTIKTYLGVIARTEVHRHIRKRRPQLGDPHDLAQAAGETPDTADGVAAAEERDVLTAALESLPDRDADILRLRFLREMDYKAIAAALRIPEASIGQTLFRAKQRLLEKLKGMGVNR